MRLAWSSQTNCQTGDSELAAVHAAELCVGGFFFFVIYFLPSEIRDTR
jgi:hypothetical protein